ncbi:hypothetical protein SUGI_0124910 [Cryptomeria japonica]|nr:hypothetical protein SUGI_0124910 [Cryptomeria japonica]
MKVKKGTYKECVKVGKTKMNIMLIGEGMDNTIMTGSRSNRSGYCTSFFATFYNGGQEIHCPTYGLCQHGWPKELSSSSSLS